MVEVIQMFLQCRSGQQQYTVQSGSHACERVWAQDHSYNLTIGLLPFGARPAFYSCSLVPRPTSSFDHLQYVKQIMGLPRPYFTQAPGYSGVIPIHCPPLPPTNTCQFRNTGGGEDLGTRLGQQSNQSKTGAGGRESTGMPRNKSQQLLNLARTVQQVDFHFCFQFPVSVSSFRFISISCFSICPAYFCIFY